jgi:uncharacterized protein (TIGR04255 family)
MSTPLPSFERPPVIEVVVGAQFGQVPIEAAHIGLFWQKLRNQYPRVESHPPLMPPLDAASNLIQVDLTSVPPIPRSFFIDSSDSWLVQFQPDRLLHNWRKRGDEQYPRFEAVYSRFEGAWLAFNEFCGSEGLNLAVKQLEVTYINHIVEGRDWQRGDDFGKLFRDLSWGAKAVTPDPIATAVTYAFTLPIGQMTVSIKQAKRMTDDKLILICELTVRGSCKEQELSCIRNWHFDARASIVHAFAELTTDEVQKSWGRL